MTRRVASIIGVLFVASTTLAARYAIGFGEGRAVDIDLTREGAPERLASVVYHEIIPYIGSGVLF